MSIADDKDFAIRAPYIQKILEQEAEIDKLRAELAEYQNMERVSCIGQLNEYACFGLVNNRGYKMSTPLFAHPTKEQGK